MSRDTFFFVKETATHEIYTPPLTDAIPIYKGGINHGRTNETGAVAVENKVHIHDLHATMLHLLGLDHENLTYRYAGRDFRLTDVYGNVVRDIIA